MSTAKEEVRKLPDQFPDEASFDELSHYDYENLTAIKAEAEFAETQGRFLSDGSLICLVKVDELEIGERYVGKY